MTPAGIPAPNLERSHSLFSGFCFPPRQPPAIYLLLILSWTANSQRPDTPDMKTTLSPCQFCPEPLVIRLERFSSRSVVYTQGIQALAIRWIRRPPSGGRRFR